MHAPQNHLRAEASAPESSQFEISLAGLQLAATHFQPTVEHFLRECVFAGDVLEPEMVKDQDRPLRSDGICDTARSVFAYLLLNEGFDVRAATMISGANVGPFPTKDHHYLSVRLDERVVLDGAYFQFLRFLGLDDLAQPDYDVLVLPESQLAARVEEFSKDTDQGHNRFILNTLHQWELIPGFGSRAAAG